MAEGNGRRYLNNLTGILGFCTEHTKTEDASGTTPMQPMTEEVLLFQ